MVLMIRPLPKVKIPSNNKFSDQSQVLYFTGNRNDTCERESKVFLWHSFPLNRTGQWCTGAPAFWKKVLMGSFCQYCGVNTLWLISSYQKLNNQLTKFLFNNQLWGVNNNGSCVSLGLDVTDNQIFQDEFSARLTTYSLLDSLVGY